MSETISPNTKLAHYLIISKIGEGGMGEVYLAQDTKLDRKVALKFLNPEFSQDRDKLKRFIQEAKSASALNHPNILTVHEIGEVNGKNYIATELIDGKTLREHLSQKEALPLNTILKIGVQVAEALAAAHQAGIIHRDIKPENIMLRRDGYAKVLDFGLAKLSESRLVGTIGPDDATRPQINTSPGIVMGTVFYMSPEQARGNPIDARTDLWSLGVVLYEMIARQSPFYGETSNHTIVAILEQEPQPLVNVSSELQRIIRKVLTKDVEMRYQSARDLLIDLKNLHRDLDIQGELERSIAPNLAVPTEPLQEQETQVNPVNSTGATGSDQAVSTQTASSLEYALTQARGHKLVTAVLGIVVLSVIAIAAYFAFVSRSGSGNQFNSIAVMPFVNESGNPEVEYLSDGMTETLIRTLSQLPNLNVKARSSVFRYKGKTADTKTIGNELNVQAILNGRVIQRGEQLSLNLELIDAQTENVIWTDQYDRKSSDLVSLQNEIARDVSSKLKLKLSGADQQTLAKNFTNDAEAYRLYLQGRFYLNKRVGKLFDRAEGYFKQAIEKDPNFALGYVGIAEFNSQQDRSKAKENIMRALAIDNQLAEAHANLGYQLMLDYDFAASEKEFKRAIELNPNFAQAYQWNGSRLLMIGKYDESLASYSRAIEIEPTLVDIRNNYAGTLVAQGKIDEAIEYLKRTIEMDPTFAWSHSHLSFVYRQKGNHAASVEERARSFELLDRPDDARKLRESLAKGGWTEYLREMLRQDWAPLGRTGTRRASILAELGEKEEALTSLINAAERGDYWLFSIKYDPAFDSLRGDPRFQELLKTFNPPQ